MGPSDNEIHNGCHKWIDHIRSTSRDSVLGFQGTLIHRIGCIVLTLGIPVIISLTNPSPTWVSLGIILLFVACQCFLLAVIPGKQIFGPVTPEGNSPSYTQNSKACYIATMCIFFVFNSITQKSFPLWIYHNFGQLISTLNILSLLVCLSLYFKGKYHPSSTDRSLTNQFLIDFYGGVELYPRFKIFGKSIDIKVLVNCRIGMMQWALITLCFAMAERELKTEHSTVPSIPSSITGTSSEATSSTSMLVCVALIQLYLLKFFLFFESDYYCTLDIAHDRAGFYLIYGCLTFVPVVYTAPAMHLVRHQGNALLEAHPLLAGGGLFLFGACMIYMNYDCDRQRQEFRKYNGRIKIWGHAPRYITAQYKTANGDTKESLLLVSGYWAMARHFHYLPELLAALAWTLPCGYTSLFPYIYIIFLVVLLLDRVHRHDARCRAKYGKFWEEYCALVPYKIVPYVY